MKKTKHLALKITLIVFACLLLAIIIWVSDILIYTYNHFVVPTEMECEHCHQVKTSRWYHDELGLRMCEDCHEAYNRGEWGDDSGTTVPGMTERGN